MKPIHALAILGLLAAAPAFGQAQDLPFGTQQQAIEPQLMARIQQQLKQDGYYNGQVDGMFGASTSRALAQWQQDKGIRPTGQVDTQTLAALDRGPGSTQQAEIPQDRPWLRQQQDPRGYQGEPYPPPQQQQPQQQQQPGGIYIPLPGTR